MQQRTAAAGAPLASASGAPAPVLEWREIRKTYGGVTALEDVSLSVRPGEILAVVGENGAGKSTLVGIAAGRVRADSGQTLIDGEPIVGSGPVASMDAGIRLVPQELMLCPDMSVLDNVLLGARPRKLGVFLDHGSARDLAARRLEALGAGVELEALAGDLSVVEQTFVQIARSFTWDARVLLVDEPTAPMDAGEVDRFLSVLEAVTASGVAVVYISHRLDEIFRLANHVAVLRDGRLVAEIPNDERARDAVIAAMTGDTEFEDPPTDARSTGQELLKVRKLSAEGIVDVDVDVHQGEIVTIYGISGSGRERLGAAIVGANKRHGGTVEVAGKKVRRNSVGAAVEAGIGYVPAERRSQGLMLEATVGDNLTLVLLWRLARKGFLRRRWTDDLAARWIKRLKIRAPDSSTPVGALSGGSQQKVLLARWLAAESPMLILEEPTRGVDIATKAEIYRIAHKLAVDGKGVLVITSDIEEASVVAESVLVMRDGTIAAELHRPTQREIAHVAHSQKELDD